MKMTEETFIQYIINQYRGEQGWINDTEVTDFFRWYVGKGYAQPVMDYILGTLGTENY